MADTDKLAEEKAYEFFKIWVCGRKYACTPEKERQIKTKKLGWNEYAKNMFEKLTEKSEMKSNMEKLFSYVHEGTPDNRNIDQININDMSCIVKKGIELRNIGRFIKYTPLQY